MHAGRVRLPEDLAASSAFFWGTEKRIWGMVDPQHHRKAGLVFRWPRFRVDPMF